MSTFVNELMRSVRYFESQQKRRSRVGKIIIFGNIGMLESIDDYLAEQTGYDVVAIDRVPFVSVALDPTELEALRDHEGEIVVALGLASEAIRAKRIELNLLPRETMVRRKAYSGLKFGIIGLIVLCAVLATLYINKNEHYNEIAAQVDDLNSKIAVVRPDYEKVQQLKGEIDIVKQKFGGIAKLAGAQIPWPILMDEIGRIMRDTVWITSFAFDANGSTWEMEGFVFTTKELQRFLVQIYDSQVLQIGELDKGTESGGGGRREDQGYSPRQGGRGGGGMRSASPPYALSGDSPGAEAQGPMLGQIGDGPQPRYKLPSGPTGWRTIEDFFRGSMWYPGVLYEFTISGSVNQEVLGLGTQIFSAEVKDFFQ
jgi:Tfp pilus assembly protein PilN